MMRVVALLFVNFVFFVQCLPSHGYSATFDMPVEEKEARFTQTIQTDLENNVIYYHTPAHNNLMEMYKIQDFNEDVEIFCLPTKSECYMSTLNRTIYHDASALTSSLAKGYAIDHNRVTNKQKIVVHKNNWFKTGSQIDINFILSKAVRDFVTEFNFPLFEVKKVPENSMLLDVEETHSNTTQERAKRDTDFPVGGGNCRGGASPSKKFGYTTAKSCDYLNWCEHGGCKRSHVESNIFYACLCCPEAHYKHECIYCSRL